MIGKFLTDPKQKKSKEYKDKMGRPIVEIVEDDPP